MLVVNYQRGKSFQIVLESMDEGGFDVIIPAEGPTDKAVFSSLLFSTEPLPQSFDRYSPLTFSIVASIGSRKSHQNKDDYFVVRNKPYKRKYYLTRFSPKTPIVFTLFYINASGQPDYVRRKKPSHEIATIECKSGDTVMSLIDKMKIKLATDAEWTDKSYDDFLYWAIRCVSPESLFSPVKFLPLNDSLDQTIYNTIQISRVGQVLFVNTLENPKITSPMLPVELLGQTYIVLDPGDSFPLEEAESYTPK
jgi:hypothetical protein